MKKLLLILICLFVSFEVKSKYIVLECEVKKTIHRINNYEGKFKLNILDTSFDLMTLYFNKKNQWLNDYKLNKEDLDKMKLDENENMTIEELGDRWFLGYYDDDYVYSFRDGWIKRLEIILNKDSGYFEYSKTYQMNSDTHIWNKHFYKKGYYTDGFDSYGICKKIKKSLLK